MRKMIFFFIASCLFNHCHSQLNTSFDFSNADRTLAILKKERMTSGEVQAFISSEGVKTIMKKIRANDSCATMALSAINNKEKVSGCAGNFQYQFIKDHMGEMDSFITRIKNNQQQIIDSVRQLEYWLPEGKSMTTKIIFLLGGYSAGFTFNDAEAFYIGTHQHKNDFMSIINSCKHELFHNVQSACYASTDFMKKLEKDSAYKELYAYYLASNLFIEGSAEYIADAESYAIKGLQLKNEIEHSSVNKYRMADNFYLIDQVITRAYDEGEKSDLDRMYSILFDWNWNNPGYATGKLMTQALVKEYGKDCLKKYLTTNPMNFVLDYILLAKAKPALYPYNFSSKFEMVVRTILAK